MLLIQQVKSAGQAACFLDAVAQYVLPVEQSLVMIVIILLAGYGHNTYYTLSTVGYTEAVWQRTENAMT